MTPPTPSISEQFKIVPHESERHSGVLHIIDTLAESDSKVKTNVVEQLAKNKDVQNKFLQVDRLNEKVVCSRGRIYGLTPTEISEVTNHNTIDETTFRQDPPDNICTHCWKAVRKKVEEKKTAEQKSQINYSEVGFKLRWKQKGRARKEWYDILVSPETTFKELDEILLKMFSTLDWLHVRMYGLEGEFEDSTPEIISSTGVHYTRDHALNNNTIKSVFEQYGLTTRDRLSMAYDLATPKQFYCIIKDTQDPTSIQDVIENENAICATKTAAVVKQKRADKETNRINNKTEESKPEKDEDEEIEDEDQENNKTFEDAMDTFSSQLSDTDKEEPRNTDPE